MSSYIRKEWIFNKCLNENFSFESDINDDGLSDGLTDVSGTHSITREGLRFHIQKTEMGEFYLEQVIDNTKDYRIYFDYKTDGDVNVLIKRYDNADQLVDTWRDESLDSSSWTYKQYAYTANASVVKLRIYFICESGETLYLDNLAIILNATNVLINPTDCNYTLVSKGRKVENIDNQIQFIEPIYNKYAVEEFSPIWGWVTFDQKAELDLLINEKILIRTHDQLVITMKIKSISYGYEPGHKELDQIYRVAIEGDFF